MPQTTEQNAAPELDVIEEALAYDIMLLQGDYY